MNERFARRGGLLSGRQSRLHNYPRTGYAIMTKAEWRQFPRECKGSWLQDLGSTSHSPHQVRVALIAGASILPVFIVDARRIDPMGL